MLCFRTPNNAIIGIYEKVLKAVFNDCNSNLRKLIRVNNDTKANQRNSLFDPCNFSPTFPALFTPKYNSVMAILEISAAR